MPRRRLLGQPNQAVKQLAFILGWVSLLFVVTDMGSTQGTQDAPESSPRCLTITVLPSSITLTMCSGHPMPAPALGESDETDEPKK